MIIEESIQKELESINEENVVDDFRPFLVIYKDGTIQRFLGTLTVPPSIDSVTGVVSKDVVISQETGVYVRMFKPPSIKPSEKVPVLVYFHGGGFVVESASSPRYHGYLNELSSKGNVIVVSVDYRLAPEHPLPAAYDDSWEALEWVRKGASGDDVWLKEHGDIDRVFLAGDSAGGNIVHNVAKRVSERGPGDDRIAVKGLVLVHPYFWGKDRIGVEHERMVVSGSGPSGEMCEGVWKLVNPGSSGLDDPLLNPGMDPTLGELVAEKVLVFIAEGDSMRDRGFYYKDVLIKSGWKGDINVVETIGENHVFHLFWPESPKAADLMNQFVAFLNAS